MPVFASVRLVLCDIEGTTTSISFVHEVLFPYSYNRLPAYIAENQTDAETLACLQSVIETVQTEENRAIDRAEAVQVLLHWIKTDRKHTALKFLQGKIWAEGYRAGAFTSHLYPEVADILQRWRAAGLALGVYSSGSEGAQKLLFGHTPAGDLTPLFSYFFDTRMGAKRETAAYENIAQATGLPPQSILFLSDVAEELDAAAQAGFQTCQLVRPGTQPANRHATAGSFDEIALNEEPPRV